MNKFSRSSLVALCAASVCTFAAAKLPAPSPEAAAKAAEAAARSAWSAKVDGYKLCLAQDRVAAHYRKTNSSAKPSAAPAAACPDPGPFASRSVRIHAPCRQAHRSSGRPFATRHRQQPPEHAHARCRGIGAQVLTSAFAPTMKAAPSKWCAAFFIVRSTATVFPRKPSIRSQGMALRIFAPWLHLLPLHHPFSLRCRD